VSEPLPSAADVLALLLDGSEQSCPACRAPLTFWRSPDGLTVELTHPVPPCAEFRAFVARLVERHRGKSRS
jgi:hypothetical protein